MKRKLNDTQQFRCVNIFGLFSTLLQSMRNLWVILFPRQQFSRGTKQKKNNYGHLNEICLARFVLWFACDNKNVNHIHNHMRWNLCVSFLLRERERATNFTFHSYMSFGMNLLKASKFFFSFSLAKERKELICTKFDVRIEIHLQMCSEFFPGCWCIVFDFSFNRSNTWKFIRS